MSLCCNGCGFGFLWAIQQVEAADDLRFVSALLLKVHLTQDGLWSITWLQNAHTDGRWCSVWLSRQKRDNWQKWIFDILGLVLLRVTTRSCSKMRSVWCPGLLSSLKWTVLYCIEHLRNILAWRIDHDVARVQVRGDLVYRALAPQHRHLTTGNLLQCVLYASAFPAIPRCWQLTHQKLKNGGLTRGWWLDAMAAFDPHVMFSCHTPLFLHLCTFE